MGGFVADTDRLGPGAPVAYRPRELCDDPESFGQMGDPLHPAEGVDPSDARFLAANLQHWVSNAVREGILLGRTNLATRLDRMRITSPDMGYDRVLRVQRGEEPMQLHDLMAWGNEFDSVREIVSLVLRDSML